jgi:hypothetical protein
MFGCCGSVWTLCCLCARRRSSLSTLCFTCSMSTLCFTCSISCEHLLPGLCSRVQYSCALCSQPHQHRHSHGDTDRFFPAHRLMHAKQIKMLPCESARTMTPLTMANSRARRHHYHSPHAAASRLSSPHVARYCQPIKRIAAHQPRCQRLVKLPKGALKPARPHLIPRTDTPARSPRACSCR